MQTHAVSPRNVRITGGFWKAKQDLVADRVIPYQWKALNDEIPGAEPSHSVENFRIAAGLKKGEFYGLIFQDSDLGKWIEAAAYCLMTRPNPGLETQIDEAVQLIAAAQEPDGYLQTYFSVKAPEKRWTDFAMGHEMYCGGHLMEGAVAYYQATGKTAFLDVMRRYADHLVKTFGPGPGQIRAYDGHPEIELALYKLYEATGEPSYQALARFFVDERGQDPSVLDHAKVIGWPVDPQAVAHPDFTYYQAHQPVRDQREAVGHAVRAMYLYSAMADQRRLGDTTLDPALAALWTNTTERKMYVTGGLGSQAHGERFTIDDDLPSDTAYTETCAAIGLVLWAWRMTLVEPDGRYADILERALYNGSLSGISLDGQRYFYVNPLEVVPPVAKFRRDHDHVKTQRVEWFGCACCPPNIARTIASFSQYQYSVADAGLWVHQFAQGEASLAFRGGTMTIEQTTGYPWDGAVEFRLGSVPPTAEPWTLAVRVPGWCRAAAFLLNGQEAPPDWMDKGYAVFDRVWKAGDRLQVNLPMEVRFVRSHPRVRETAGKVAVHRGPLLYCVEEADNGPGLHRLSLVTQGATVEPAPELREGSLRLRIPAVETTVPATGEAFLEGPPGKRLCDAVLVPYHLWGNRGEGEMRVWLRAAEYVNIDVVVRRRLFSLACDWDV